VTSLTTRQPAHYTVRNFSVKFLFNQPIF